MPSIHVKTHPGARAFALLVCGVFLFGCERPQASPPELRPSARDGGENDAGGRAGRDVEAPSQPAFHGTPVAVTKVQVLHDTSGLRVERQQWKFGATQGAAWRVRLPLDAGVSLSSGNGVMGFQRLVPTGDGPWAAINGGFYELIPKRRAYRPMGLVVSEGKRLSKLTGRGGSGVFYVDGDGPAIVKRSAYGAQHPRVALQSIDRLVADGKSVVSRQHATQTAARSAVVVGRSHLWFVVAVDARDFIGIAQGARLTTTSHGLSLWAFAEYLRATTDVRDALNLDGGVSTQMAVQDGSYALRIDGVRGTINALVARPPD